jgi:predicted GIY-YIG superfamily endonuclease
MFIMANNMKKYLLYEVINLYGTVEYVGITTDSNGRWRQHTMSPRFHKSGKITKGQFHKRQDVFMNIVDSYDSKMSARNAEDLLKDFYGFDKSEYRLNQRLFDKCDILNIRKSYPEKTINSLSNEYNCSWITIYKIIHNQRYNDITR